MLVFQFVCLERIILTDCMKWFVLPLFNSSMHFIAHYYGKVFCVLIRSSCMVILLTRFHLWKVVRFVFVNLILRIYFANLMYYSSRQTSDGKSASCAQQHDRGSQHDCSDHMNWQRRNQCLKLRRTWNSLYHSNKRWYLLWTSIS